MIPMDFEVNLWKVKVTVTVNMLIYKPNLVQMIIDLGLSNFAHTFVQSVDDPYQIWD